MPITNDTAKYVLGGPGGAGADGSYTYIHPNTTNIGVNNGSSVTSVQPIDLIQGQMISVDKTFTLDEIERLGLDLIPQSHIDQMKKILIEDLMIEIVRNKCIEFTKQDLFAEASIRFRARIFVTPDDKVRILRKNNIGD